MLPASAGSGSLKLPVGKVTLLAGDVVILDNLSSHKSPSLSYRIDFYSSYIDHNFEL